MADCPACGTPGAYNSGFTIECSNPLCRFFTQEHLNATVAESLGSSLKSHKVSPSTPNPWSGAPRPPEGPELISAKCMACDQEFYHPSWEMPSVAWSCSCGLPGCARVVIRDGQAMVTRFWFLFS